MIILWKARLMPGRVFSVQWSSEELYTKDRFCYDKENRQLRQNVDGTSGAAVDKNKAECGKAAGYIKMVGKKDVQSEQGIEQ